MGFILQRDGNDGYSVGVFVANECTPQNLCLYVTTELIEKLFAWDHFPSVNLTDAGFYVRKFFLRQASQSARNLEADNVVLPITNVTAELQYVLVG